jgi:cell filamentation protein
LDKYGAGQDLYCYPGTTILRNKLNIQDDTSLFNAERDFSELAASQIGFSPPPYDLPYLQQLHRTLFEDVYEWAGCIRTVDIAKDTTRFCNINRIEPEATKIFAAMADASWYEGYARDALVAAIAESFGDLNVVHPFREGNGRAQRILFEHLILNAGFEVNWWCVEPQAWLDANIAAVVCDYAALARIFDRCIGQPITA